MKKAPKVIVYDKLIFSFKGILPNKIRFKIYHKNHHKFATKCVKLNNMLDNHFKETDIYDVICEKCSELNGDITKTIFDQSHSIKRPPIFKNNLQITYYDRVTCEVKKVEQE